MATNIGKRILRRTGQEFAEIAVGQALALLGNNPDRNAKYLLQAVDHFVKGEKQQITREWLHNWLAEGKPGREFLSRMLKNTHPNVRKRYIARMMTNIF